MISPLDLTMSAFICLGEEWEAVGEGEHAKNEQKLLKYTLGLTEITSSKWVKYCFRL
jgi:hypothetical protein